MYGLVWSSGKKLCWFGPQKIQSKSLGQVPGSILRVKVRVEARVGTRVRVGARARVRARTRVEARTRVGTRGTVRARVRTRVRARARPRLRTTVTILQKSANLKPTQPKSLHHPKTRKTCTTRNSHKRLNINYCPPSQDCAPKENNKLGATGEHFGACASLKYCLCPSKRDKNFVPRRKNTSKRQD